MKKVIEGIHVHISKCISKLSAMIPSVSLPAGPSCRPDAPCFKLCYARKGRFQFNNVKTPLERNFYIWQNHPDRFEREVMDGIAETGCQWFRWHSSGDIPDALYFSMMVRIAEHFPEVKFLCFTKRYEIINNFIDDGGVIPDNLNVVLSAWGEWIPKNPHNLPMSYIRFKNQDSPIPEDAHPCNGFCGQCVFSECNCWTLKHGESVVFNQH